jgi:hypothetical protein
MVTSLLGFMHKFEMMLKYKMMFPNQKPTNYKRKESWVAYR